MSGRQRKNAKSAAPGLGVGDGSEIPELVPPASLADFEIGGPFRWTYLVWFENPDERRALEELGRGVEVALRVFVSAQEASRRRAHAIAADLDELARFLAHVAVSRVHSSLSIPDWQLAHLAAQTGEALTRWAASLATALGIGELGQPTEPWDRDRGLRETELWPAEDSPLAEALRSISRMVFSYARRIGNLTSGAQAAASSRTTAPGAEASGTYLDIQAAAVDLLHLASFTADTAAELPVGDPLKGLLGRLTYVLARGVEGLCRGLEDQAKPGASA